MKSGYAQSKLQCYFENISFPCTKREIVKYAELNYAPDRLLDAIEILPQKRYNNAKEVLGLITVVSRANIIVG